MPQLEVELDPSRIRHFTCTRLYIDLQGRIS